MYARAVIFTPFKGYNSQYTRINSKKGVDFCGGIWYNYAKEKIMSENLGGRGDSVTENNRTTRDMPRQTVEGEGKVKLISEQDIIAAFAEIPKQKREKMIADYDVKSLAKIFENDAMMKTVDTFLRCGLSVCRAADELYMHRNTLIYRLNSVARRTGLDVRDFNSAITFKILHYLYLLK